MDRVRKDKVLKFIVVGVGLTLLDYIVYTLIVMIAYGGDTSNAGVGAVISGVVATIAAYIAHSNITWKTRDPGKYGPIKFFAWNAVAVLVIRPVLVAFFSLLTGLYQFAFGIFQFLHIPFSYEFVESTGIYVLMTAVIMILNFTVYERLVFGKEKEQRGKKIDVRRVGQTGEKSKRDGVSQQKRK